MECWCRPCTAVRLTVRNPRFVVYVFDCDNMKHEPCFHLFRNPWFDHLNKGHTQYIPDSISIFRHCLRVVEMFNYCSVFLWWTNSQLNTNCARIDSNRTKNDSKQCSTWISVGKICRQIAKRKTAQIDDDDDGDDDDDENHQTIQTINLQIFLFIYENSMKWWNKIPLRVTEMVYFSIKWRKLRAQINRALNPLQVN